MGNTSHLPPETTYSPIPNLPGQQVTEGLEYPAPMTLSPADWHERYLQQARWTADLRAHLWDRLDLGAAGCVMEVGCGTGAVLREVAGEIGGTAHGLDIDWNYLRIARRYATGALLVQGDAHDLPFRTGSFTATYCHFLLLWVKDPVRVLREMVRITRPGGVVMALAEPDYGGRIDYPEPLARLGAWQTAALRDQGAETELGRRLAALFHEAGVAQVETGLLGGRWGSPDLPESLEQEWAVLRADLGDRVPEAALEELFELDRAAWAWGERVLYVPTFYAWGRVPEFTA